MSDKTVRSGDDMIEFYHNGMDLEVSECGDGEFYIMADENQRGWESSGKGQVYITRDQAKELLAFLQQCLDRPQSPNDNDRSEK